MKYEASAGTYLAVTNWISEVIDEVGGFGDLDVAVLAADNLAGTKLDAVLAAVPAVVMIFPLGAWPDPPPTDDNGLDLTPLRRGPEEWTMDTAMALSGSGYYGVAFPIGEDLAVFAGLYGDWKGVDKRELLDMARPLRLLEAGVDYPVVDGVHDLTNIDFS